MGAKVIQAAVEGASCRWLFESAFVLLPLQYSKPAMTLSCDMLHHTVQIEIHSDMQSLEKKHA